MSQHDPDEINRLIGRFTDLLEQWQEAPDRFDWSHLQALAQEGAQAYNEGAGPSFHALALDGVEHTEFHERFLGHSLHAGFDPFRLTHTGSHTPELPVIDHASLAQAALANASAARMRTSLMELARARFGPALQNLRDDQPQQKTELLATIEPFAESIPVDLLERISPELARSHPRDTRRQVVDPIEGYLSAAEVQVESATRPYG